MKKLLFSLLLLSSFFSAFAKTNTVIKGVIHSTEEYYVHVYTPVYSFYNFINIDTSAQNSLTIQNNSFTLRPEINYPSFFSLVFLYKKNNFFANRANFLVMPGDSINLNINLDDTKTPSWIFYGGDNASGNNLFERINYQPYQKFSSLINHIESLSVQNNITCQNFVDVIENDLLMQVKQFQNLLTKKRIDLKYYRSMEATFRILFYKEVVKRFLFENDHWKYIRKSFRDSVMEYLYKKRNATEYKVRGLYSSPFYLEFYYYYLAYKKYHLPSADVLGMKDSVIIRNNVQYTINRDLVPILFIEDKKAQEDWWALNIMADFEFYKGWLDYSSIRQFESIFPYSKWIPLLNKSFYRKNHEDTIAYRLLQPITFIPNNRIKKLKDLTLFFPNQFVYVDVWASWCVPCIQQFSFNNWIDSFLLKQNIQRVYIGVNNESDQQNWRNAIDKYQLGGFHLLANRELITDIKKAKGIDSTGNYGIPTYFFITKNGEIHDLTDTPPSSQSFVINKLKELANEEVKKQ